LRSPFAILCSLTVAASFALIFLLAPMVTKTAPSLPGGAALFYQIAVLAGAFYAHFLGLLPLRVQGVVHAALGVAALLTLPLADGVVAMGALAANVALVPRWFSLARPKQTPWRIFGLGLAGGLLALFAGPLLLPSSQAWFFVYGLVIAAAFVIAWKAKDSAKGSDSPAPASRKTPLTAALALRWILLAAIPSGLMQSLASVWAADSTAILALYFATLALAFSGLPDVLVGATRRYIPLPLIAVGVGLAAVFAQTAPNLAALSLSASAFFLVAFVVAALGCHCQLARQKPDVSSLSFFVLAVALGAVLGGFALELFAQRIAFAIGLILAGLLIGAQEERNTSVRRRLHPHVAAAAAALLVGVALSWSEPAGDSAEAFSQLRGPLDGN
jgi:MFS family permease